MRSEPLDELELFEILRAAYPERFPDESDETWDAAQDFADNISGIDDIQDLLGRVVMLSMPMQSPLTKMYWHSLGSIEVSNGQLLMNSYVSREFNPDKASKQ